MDDIVKQAMAKWPDVPHCYGWLALDARGGWRMRDEHAQQANLPGDRLGNAALLAFINRNYAADARGCWYFQNGPQRVYVNLETTPYVARTDPAQGLVLQTGEALGHIDKAYMTAAGALIVQAGGKLAQVDDRDVAQLLATMERNGAAVDDDALLAWLEAGSGTVSLRLHDARVDVERLPDGDLGARFGFVANPHA
ncbi:DUF2946 family protein [Massilia sp. S19_KUP03_FR1]|uniref:DUF2946 family protein n=1 Tax=Massilia sp. S19_KUP03_FR1 TaxID=3025503 RepID=UPI002FCD8474